MPKVPADSLFAFDSEWIVSLRVVRVKDDVAIAQPIQLLQQKVDALVAQLFQCRRTDILARGILKIAQVAIAHG